MGRKYLTCGECKYWEKSEVNPPLGTCLVYLAIPGEQRGWSTEPALGFNQVCKCYFNFETNHDFSMDTKKSIVRAINDSNDETIFFGGPVREEDVKWKE